MMSAQNPVVPEPVAPVAPFPERAKARPALPLAAPSAKPAASAGVQASARALHPVLACVDGTGAAEAVVQHARAIADALGEPLVVLQVLEPLNGQGPADPVEWAIRQREATGRLEALARHAGHATCGTGTMLREGWAPHAIDDAARSLAAGLIVLGTRDRASERPAGLPGAAEARGPLLGLTARDVLARTGQSVLLQPPGLAPETAQPYRRILVPLDGSCWSEAAVPMAVRLARGSGAELLLAHVVTQPELTGQQPPEADDLELLDRLVARNERIGRAYLDRLRRSIGDSGVKVDSLIFRCEDSRSGLADLIDATGFDLVVLSARGRGANCGMELPYGSTVGYLAGRCPVPMLVVHPDIPVAQSSARNASRMLTRARFRPLG